MSAEEGKRDRKTKLKDKRGEMGFLGKLSFSQLGGNLFATDQMATFKML